MEQWLEKVIALWHGLALQGKKKNKNSITCGNRKKQKT